MEHFTKQEQELLEQIAFVVLDDEVMGRRILQEVFELYDTDTDLKDVLRLKLEEKLG